MIRISRCSGGEFLGLNGGADFYADDVAGLHREGEASLAAFIDECARRGIEPRKSFSGKFMLRVESKMHQSGSNRHSSSWGKLESVGGERHPQFISRLMRSNDFRSLVRRRGLEPLHLLRRQDLNLVRLPISPPSLMIYIVNELH